jgi:hypothetical protein
MDAIIAFIQSEVLEEIYIKQPTSFEAGRGLKVYCLKHALYRLKQLVQL